MLTAQLIKDIAVMALPLLFAVSFHESAHGYVANKLGDSTAKDLGRITLNPLRHIDPFGTILLPILLMVTGGSAFGYAKPVPVNNLNLRRPREDMAIVAVAGPLSNLFLAILSAILFKTITHFFVAGTLQWFFEPVIRMLIFSVQINVILAIINLIPLPPADGGRIVVGLLPLDLARKYSRIEPYGMIILIVILVVDPLGMFSRVLMPIFNGLVHFFLT